MKGNQGEIMLVQKPPQYHTSNCLLFFRKNSLTHLVLQWLYVVVHKKSSMQEHPYNNLVILESATKLHSYITETLLQTFHLGLGDISTLFFQNPSILQSATTNPPSPSPREKDHPPSSHSIHGKRHTFFSCM